MKIYIIAGEASGDLHASNLVRELKDINSELQIRAWGGNLVEKAGAELVKHYKETAFMGFLTVAKNFKKILRNIAFCKNSISKWKPDVLILVDYPGFNLKIARFAKHKKIPVFYFISPKIWAWKKWRIKSIKKYVDKMYVILPFEKDFYRKHDYTVYYVGNPLVNVVDEFLKNKKGKTAFIKDNKLEDKPIIALLPGSRKQEIQSMLPIMTKIGDNFPEYQLIIAATAGFSKNYYKQFIKNKDIKILINNTYSLIDHATAAVVASGTATLETALLNTPQVVIYKQKGGILVEKIAKLVYPDYFSLVNLILQRRVVKELFMTKVTAKNISKELSEIFFSRNYQNSMLENYDKLRAILGQHNAAKKTANLILKHLNTC